MVVWAHCNLVRPPPFLPYTHSKICGDAPEIFPDGGGRQTESDIVTLQTPVRRFNAEFDRLALNCRYKFAKLNTNSVSWTEAR